MFITHPLTNGAPPWPTAPSPTTITSSTGSNCHPRLSNYSGDKLDFDPDCYCGAGVPVDEEGICTGPNALQNKLGEWNEWYLDIHTPKCYKHVKSMMERRILQAAEKGCDGVDPDNVDEVSLNKIIAMIK